MTPEELVRLADAATPGPWPNFKWARVGLSNDADRLVALAPDLALLVAEMGEALDVLRNGYDDHERECASLWEEPSRSMPCDCAVGVIAAALTKLSELEAR